jgi:hypothetical protein
VVARHRRQALPGQHLPGNTRSALSEVLPTWIKPQLAALVKTPPDGDGWLYEIKFDSYRMHARLDHGRLKLLTRTGLDWTLKYPAVSGAFATLHADTAYLDGELCGMRPGGTTSFAIIQNASDGGNAASLVFYLFDLLYLDRKPILTRLGEKGCSFLGRLRLAMLLKSEETTGRGGGFCLIGARRDAETGRRAAWPHQVPDRPFPYLRINQTRRWRSAAWAISCGCQLPDPLTSIVYANGTATGSRGTRVVAIVIPDGLWTIRRTAPSSVMTKSVLG